MEWLEAEGSEAALGHDFSGQPCGRGALAEALVELTVMLDDVREHLYAHGHGVATGDEFAADLLATHIEPESLKDGADDGVMLLHNAPRGVA